MWQPCISIYFDLVYNNFSIYLTLRYLKELSKLSRTAYGSSGALRDNWCSDDNVQWLYTVLHHTPLVTFPVTRVLWSNVPRGQ